MSKSMFVMKDLTFGCEIECLAPDSKLSRIVDYIANHFGTNSTSDGSITGQRGFDPFEIRTKVYNFTKDDLNEYRKLIQYLKDQGVIVNKSCGGHVHIGIKPYLTKMNMGQRVSFMMHVYENFYNVQEALYRVNGGDDRRNGQYAREISPVIKTLNENLMPRFENYGRYFGLNTESYREHGTIEFRVFEGTIDPETWITNISIAAKLIWNSANNHTLPVLAPSEWDKLGEIFKIDLKTLKEYKVIYRTRELQDQLKALHRASGTYTVNHAKLWKMINKMIKGVELTTREAFYLKIRKLMAASTAIVIADRRAYLQINQEMWYIDLTSYGIEVNKNSGRSRDNFSISVSYNNTISIL